MSNADFQAMAEIDDFGPMSTSERLRVLAARLRAEVKTGRWRQNYFETGPLNWEDVARGNASVVPMCGSTLCTAGWTVTMMPPSEIEMRDDSWESAACRGLGLSDDLGDMLFYWIPERAADEPLAYRLIPEFLEFLADLPESKRTRDDVRDTLPDDMLDRMRSCGASI